MNRRVRSLLGFGDLDTREFSRAVRSLRFAIAGEHRRLAAAAALALTVAGAELLRPWPMKVVIDTVESPTTTGGLGPTATVTLAALVSVLIPLAIGFLDLRLAVKVATIGRTVTTRVRHRLFVHLHRLGMPFHQRSRSGDLLMRLTGDISLMRDLLVATWIELLGRTAIVIGAAVVLALLDPFLALLALAPLPLLAVGAGRSSKRLKALTKTQRKREGAVAARASESLRQIRAVKAYGAEDRLGAAFSNAASRSERAGVKAAREAGRMSMLTEGMTGAGSALVLLAGAHGVATGSLSLGDLVVAVSYTRMLYKPLRKMSGQGGRLAKATGCATRLLEILETEPEPYDEGERAPRFRGDIELEGVWAGYGVGAPALRGIDLTIPAGTTVVLDGPNGSGKSTLLAVLLRLVSPTSGTVRIDGHPADALRLESYRASFAYVPQDLLLFGVSAADNIRFGNPDATDEEIRAAASVSLFDEVAARLDDGYETELGEAGASLSGGEARRLMLARAAVRDAPILLLDEPLAGLDPQAAAGVCAAVRRLAEGRTTIIVHHGDATAFAPDLTLSMRHGLIVPAVDDARRSSPAQQVHVVPPLASAVAGSDATGAER